MVFKKNNPIEEEPVGIIEMLYVSSVVAVVGVQEKGIFSSRRITFWDTNKNSVCSELTFMTNVIAIYMNQTR